IPPEQRSPHPSARTRSMSLMSKQEPGVELEAAVVCNPGRTEFFRSTLALLNSTGIPYMVGGAYGLAPVTGIVQPTKDLDLFGRRGDCIRMLRVLDAAGYKTAVPFPHWLGKATSGPHYIDFIFNSGNGAAPVDDIWLEQSMPAEV